MMRPPMNGPRSLIRIVTDRPFLTFVTRKRVPNGNVGCEAVSACLLKLSALAVSLSTRIEAGKSKHSDSPPGRSSLR